MRKCFPVILAGLGLLLAAYRCRAGRMADFSIRSASPRLPAESEPASGPEAVVMDAREPESGGEEELVLPATILMIGSSPLGCGPVELYVFRVIVGEGGPWVIVGPYEGERGPVPDFRLETPSVFVVSRNGARVFFQSWADVLEFAHEGESVWVFGTPAETEDFKKSVEGQAGIPVRLTISSEWSMEDAYSEGLPK